MRFDVITVMPEILQALQHGLVGQALHQGLWQLCAVNPRRFCYDNHQSVDDRPFGGGDGMVLKAEPLAKAVDFVRSELESTGMASGPVILFSAHGSPISTALCERLAAESQVTLICGRYAGVDQRFINAHVDQEISLGDFILSGGEIAALALIDAVVRLLPGVLGNCASARSESFYSQLLEAPQFTRPREFEDQSVPAVLTSGCHASIARWQRLVAILVTEKKRPDLCQTLSQQELDEAHRLRNEMSSSEKKVLGLL